MKNRLDFIRVLQNGILNIKEDYSNVDYKEVLKIAVSQGMGGLIYSFIEEYIPSDKRFELSKLALATIQKNAIYDNEFKKICEELEKNNIRGVTYKGNVIKYLYPNKDLRLMGDIDITFDKKNSLKIDKIMNDLGYTREHEFGAHHKFRKKPNILIEFHESLHEDNMNLKIYDDIFSHVIPLFSYKCIYTLDETYHFMYLITHIYQHMSSNGAGIRNYTDLYLFEKNNKDKINYELIKEELTKENLYDFYLQTLNFTHKLFKEKSNMTDSLFNEYLDYIFRGGIYGVTNHKDMEIRIMANENNSKIGHVFKRLFPKPMVLINSHESFKKHKILWIFVPFLYMTRIIKLIFNPKKFKEKAKALGTNNSEIKKAKEFAKKIGIVR